ncbi:putative ATP-grasp-modified RiPP [Streptomyces fuscigenes]|uniref:putative ATP-grasp-modified RiPP n=1 Tax=Streptomyces fuscigenes TaxID=1528880 RepID=UPI001F22CF84|nr:putative ATP-grasp-modified RiPP [Streptomyces fuscigenes]MCF3960926.1 putative ATP-grasp-modified RiPP [Streptomyces fuscigenes]
MFVHSDRLPTGTPLPSGSITPRPWGLTRMAPYPTQAQGYSRTELNPLTQTATYYDLVGAEMPAPKHGTSSGTKPTTGTSPDGQGKGDSDSGNDTDQ